MAWHDQEAHLKRVVEERVLHSGVGGAGVDEAEAEARTHDAGGLRAVVHEVERVGLREDLLVGPHGLVAGLVVGGRRAVEPRGEREAPRAVALIALRRARAHQEAHNQQQHTYHQTEDDRLRTHHILDSNVA